MAVILLSVLLAGCGDAGPRPFAYSGRVMGTTYQVKVVAHESEVSENLGDEIYAALDNIDRKMSTYQPGSELNRLNAAAVGSDIAVSGEMLNVLLLSQQVYRDTGGAFDPTVGPLVDLWGFGPGYQGDEIPGANAIRDLLRQVDFQALRIDRNNAVVRKTRPLSLDLSAVAKGYAADRVGELLQLHGLSSYMVEVGGEMRLSGVNNRGTPWQIAIEKPDPGSRTVQRIVGVSDAGVATSGDYRNYFEKNGTRYSHTLDPRTGYPITHALASVTVVTDNSGLSDALATAFMVMGTEQTLAFAEQRNIAVYTLTKKEGVFEEAYSSAFRGYLGEAQ